MYHLINNQKGKVSFRAIVVTLIVVLALTGVFFMEDKVVKKNALPGGVVAYFNIELPQKYTEPMIVSTLKHSFSVQPVGAASVDKIDEGDNTVRYIDPYPKTDIVQEIQSNKLKEDIILKAPGHPEEFSYKINLDKYDFEVDSINDFVFYEKGHIGDSLYRVFTIPAPFMWDSAGRVSNNREVETNLTEDGILTLKPSKQWLANATYPVTVDPTVEINVLNIQSYPTVGGPWEVRFTTEGTEDLTITGMSHDDISTIFNTDIEFASLTCGSEERLPIFNESNNSYVYENWSCGEIAYFTSTVLLEGKHHLEFDFGGEIANAYNDATGFTDPTSNGSGSTCDSPTNAFISNGSDTLCNPTLGVGVLDVDTFGFDITSSSIDGIEVRVEAAINSTSATYYASCQLLDDSGNNTGATKNTSNWTTTSDVAYTVGGASDMWSTSFTEATIEDADFGVRCSMVKTSGTALKTLRVDNIDIQITYTAAAVADTVSDDWCSTYSSWTKRRKITLDNSSQSTALTNFPAAVILNSGRVDYSVTQNSGQDLRFCDQDNSTALDYEIEVWNESGTSVAWVEVPNITAASSTEHIWMYYHNDGASDNSTTTGVWDENFTGVYHMEETTSSYLDSTRNARHLTSVTLDSRTATPKIGNNAPDFTGTGNTVKLDTADDNYDCHGKPADITISGWGKDSSLGDGRDNLIDFDDAVAIRWGDGGDDLAIGYIQYGASSWQNTTDSTTAPYDGEWYYNSFVNDDSGNSQILYIDGSSEATASQSSSIYWDDCNAFGTGIDKPWIGYADEIRVSNIARDPDWIAFEYCNMNDSCNTYGDEEAGANSAPTISSVRDYPDPISAGDAVYFSVDWSDSGDQVKAKVCKSDALSAQNCTGGAWASSTAFTTTDPEIVSYTTASESGSQNYYVFVCDDEGDCSSSTSGTFTVHSAGAKPVKFRGGTIKLRSGTIKLR
jgi:hypothetical protein